MLSERLQDYQRNAVFVGFMLVVCTAALVYLTQSLREVLFPLIWACFVAMPLNGIISWLRERIDDSFIWVVRCLRCRPRHRNQKHQDLVHFKVLAGERGIRVRREEGNVLLKKVNGPWCGSAGHADLTWLRCRGRVKIVSLSVMADKFADLPEREVNRVVKGWKYYIREGQERPATSPTSGEGVAIDTDDHMVLEMYLDKSNHYPAIVTPESSAPNMEGMLSVNMDNALSWVISVILALSGVMLVIWGFMELLTNGANNINKEMPNYTKGGQEFVKWVGWYASSLLPKDQVAKINRHAQEFISESLPELASDILKVIEDISIQFIIFILYLLFWILEPLPINSNVANLFKTYLIQKTLVCALFACLMGGLLKLLQCKLWTLLSVVTMVLNYVPEIGPFAVFMVSLPLILLDGELDESARGWNTVWFTVFFLLFKFITANIIEVQLYAKSGGDLMRMHPVVMMASMMMLHTFMGITGMFMTVPLLAATKYYMLSINMPPSLLDPLLLCLEGTEQGPHMNYVDQRRAMASPEAVSPTLTDAEDSEATEFEATFQSSSRAA